MLTLRDLVAEMGLELTTGEDAADVPVRWIHTTELPDPTPWLTGGEMILTTGIQLSTPKLQRQFVRLMCEREVSGLGFGTGLAHKAVPKPLIKEAVATGLPVFEVPYELPFIAITEKAFTRIVNEQYEMLQRGTAIHKRLERLVIEKRGLGDLVGALSAAIGSTAAVLDRHGTVMAESAFRRSLSEDALAAIRDQLPRWRDADEASELTSNHPDLAGRSLILPVSTRRRGMPEAWLVAVHEKGGLGDFERLILQQAVTVVALELMRQHVMRDTERRLAGDVLNQALTGRLSESEVASRLRPFGVKEQSAMLVFTCGDDPAGCEAEVESAIAEEGRDALVAIRKQMVCAVVDASEGLDPVALALKIKQGLEEGGVRKARAATSRVGPTGLVRRNFQEARYALEATGLTDGATPEVASYEDLGGYQLLLGVQGEDALRIYADRVLGPLDDGKSDYGGELIRSLEAFIEENGQWEKAARKLYCHRHTLRYRIKRIEELTGRDLNSARNRIEFWLALRARELIG